MSSRPSIVAELMCGSRTTLASWRSFGLIAGSCSNTSRPAPASSRLCSIRVSAASSITSPREVLTTLACGRSNLSRRAESRWKVAGVCGQLTLITSMRASIWSKLSQYVASSSFSSASGTRRRLW